MSSPQKIRRTISALLIIIGIIVAIVAHPESYQTRIKAPGSNSNVSAPATSPASDALGTIAVKGRAPKTDYARSQFGDGWASSGGCDTRNIILKRDLKTVTTDTSCRVVAGTLDDPYTGNTIEFQRGAASSQRVQIDHVVALSNAWQTGAQSLPSSVRVKLANDPLELLAVDGPANQQKSDGDAATWLPPNKPFRCAYVARQIAVKVKYHLWLTASEKQAIVGVLSTCPGQTLPAK